MRNHPDNRNPVSLSYYLDRFGSEHISSTFAATSCAPRAPILNPAEIDASATVQLVNEARANSFLTLKFNHTQRLTEYHFSSARNLIEGFFNKIKHSVASRLAMTSSPRTSSQR